MGKIQKGFTLIELMVVIAVIGIFSVLALAAYQDYQVRSQVSEAMSLASGLKADIGEYHTENGYFPGNNNDAGAPDPDEIKGKYVTTVAIVNGVIRVTLGRDINLKVFGETVELSPSFTGGSFAWNCDRPGTTVPNKYLPSVCR